VGTVGAVVSPLATLAALCALRRAVRLLRSWSGVGRGLWLAYADGQSAWRP
jgi:hypothetical protein